MFIKRFLERDQTTHKHISLEMTAQREKVIRDSTAFKEENRARFLIAVLFLVSLHKAQIQHWVVTKSHQVWVIKHQILDGFLSTSVLAGPKLIRSHPEETCREPPTFPAQPSQSCFQDTKAHVSPLLPGFSNCYLMGHTLPGHVMDTQQRPASTTQIKPFVTWPSAGGGRSEKHLYTGSKVTTNSAPGRFLVLLSSPSPSLAICS